MIGRVRHMERYGVAAELEPGRWALSDRAEQVLTRNGLAEERGIS
jgi:hypothetical protein